MTNPPARIWTGNTVNTGLSGTIVAGGNLIGDFSGQVNNTTIINNALASDFVSPNSTTNPGIQNQDTTKGQEGKDGLTGAGNSNLSSGNSSDTSAELVNGQSNNLPGYSGIISPQGVDPSLHVSLPGFSGTGSASISDILSAITGGQALFKPANQSVTSGGSGLHSTSGGGISGGASGGGATNVVSSSTINGMGGANNITNGNTGSNSTHVVTIPSNNTNNSGGVNTGNSSNGSLNTATNANVSNVTMNVPTNNPSANTVTTSTIPVNTQSQQGNVNTTPLQPTANYLIETKPAYTSVTQFYGSQYLLDRLSINGSYMFLGDAGFDSTYIQQQYIQATGQSYPGGTYMTASDAMKTMLNNAADTQSKLGLQFGTALTKEQQAALDEDIVWYVPVVVDGKTVLAPQLYLSPKTDILAGASIKGKNVDITAGSINNSGLMQGTESIALTATNGDISNIGGTIKGGKISLNAQNGSVINADTVNTYLVNGGTGSYLGSQGQIIGTGTVGIKASDSITTHGGTIQSGSDLAMQASTINIGAAQLNASASSVTYASDGPLKFKGNQTLNYGTTITSGGNAILQATGGDLTLAGSSPSAQGSVSLASAGSIGLNAVTNSGFSDVKGKKSGAFNSSSFQNTNAYTSEVGSNITSGGQLNVVAQKNVDISGNLTAANNVNILAKDGGITENALKSTSDTYDYHHTNKTGFWGSETGLSAQVGTKKSTTKNSNSSVTYTGSIIASTSGNVNMSANNDININGSNVLAKQDINMSGDNINFNTVQNKTNGNHYQKDSFTGLSVGVSGQSVIGGVAQNSLKAAYGTDGASMATSIGSASTVANNAAIGASGIMDSVVKDPKNNEAQALAADKANAKQHAAVDYNLLGVSASVGHQSSKSKNQTVTTTDVGSMISAGGKVNINAKNEINATGTSISGNDVIFNAGGDINLKAGQKTQDTKSSSSSNKIGVGASASVGIAGGSVGLTAEGSLGWVNSKSSSKTAIDTVVNGTNSVVMNNQKGSLNINGAQITNNNADGTISDGSITINTGNLNITTPQNTAKYDSSQYQVGISGSLPLVAAGFGNALDSFGKPMSPDTPFTQGTLSGGIKDIHNNYKSTEQTMSGLYAGKGGLDVNVSGTTTLTGGSITSAADADKNQITTSLLIGNSLDNKSVWSGLNVSGGSTVTSQYTVAGTATDAKDNHLLPGNVLNKASGLGIAGNVVMHNEHTTTDSVIGGNITVNAGSTTGKIVKDADAANGYIKDQFDANKMQSNFDKQNNLTQQLTTIGNSLTDLAVSAIDKHHPEIIAEGKETGHMISSGIGAVGGAALGGGNVGATATGVVAGDLMNGLASDASQQLADKISPEQKNPSNPKNGGATDTNKVENQSGYLNPNDSSKEKGGSDASKNPTYDTTTDINKVVSNITHDVIVGGFGAIAGIVFGGGNAGLDATAGGITSLKVAPKIEKPKDQKVDTKTKDKQPKPGEQNAPTK